VKVLPGFATDEATSGRAGTQPLSRTVSSRLCNFIELRQTPLYIQRSMKDTQDVNVIVCDNVGNAVMTIKSILKKLLRTSTPTPP